MVGAEKLPGRSTEAARGTAIMTDRSWLETGVRLRKEVKYSEPRAFYNGEGVGGRLGNEAGLPGGNLWVGARFGTLPVKGWVLCALLVGS